MTHGTLFPSSPACTCYHTTPVDPLHVSLDLGGVTFQGGHWGLFSAFFLRRSHHLESGEGRGSFKQTGEKVLCVVQHIWWFRTFAFVLLLNKFNSLPARHNFTGESVGQQLVRDNGLKQTLEWLDPDAESSLMINWWGFIQANRLARLAPLSRQFCFCVSVRQPFFCCSGERTKSSSHPFIMSTMLVWEAAELKYTISQQRQINNRTFYLWTSCFWWDFTKESIWKPRHLFAHWLPAPYNKRASLHVICLKCS